MGKRTRFAIKSFQKNHDLEVSGELDPGTQVALGLKPQFSSAPKEEHQIDPSDMVGKCLESKNIFAAYEKNKDEFDKRFNEVPLCISGYPHVLGEQPDYFYIDVHAKQHGLSDAPNLLALQCRIEKVNSLHRQLLKRSLSIDPKEKIQVKGIYNPSLDASQQRLVLDQCYLIQTTAGHN